MTEETFYKVLWVEDDQSIIESYQLRAERNDIELEVASNWEEAEDKLRINFNEYSAIILDAFCKIKKEDSVASKIFLGYVSVRISRIFGERHKFIPWYVLSAGTMDNFDIVLQLINSEERQRFDSLWGPLKYIKGGTRKLPGSDKEVEDEDYLFENIKNVAIQTGINAVLFRHSEVFKYIGKDRIFDYVEARRYILKMLSALYYPEENLNFEYEGNPLRKVVEFLFRAANKYGLLPDEMIDKENRVILQWSSLYLAGKKVNYKDGVVVRYGVQGKNANDSDSDSVFSYEISTMVKNILDFTNSDSHTNEDEPYVIEENKKEIFFGYVLQLCHVIKWFGNYIEIHSDIEQNKSMIRIVKTDNKESIKMKDVEKTVKMKDVEKIVEIPSATSLLETSAYIMRTGKAGKLTCGQYCKIDYNYSSDMGKKAIIKKIVLNDSHDSKEFPYIATEIEIITDKKETEK